MQSLWKFLMMYVYFIDGGMHYGFASLIIRILPHV